MFGLKSIGLDVVAQMPIQVRYKGKEVGSFFADIVVENKVILELKAAERIHLAHISQLMNYLKARTIEVGLVFNFGKEPEFRRKAYDNANKLFS